MVRVIDTGVNLDFPLGHHLHCLVAQIPIRLRRSEHGYAIEDRDAQWLTVRSVLDLVAEGEQNLKKLHILLLPESAVPLERFDDVLAAIEKRFRPNTVTVFGMEQARLHAYREVLERFHDDNAEAIALVKKDLDSGAPPEIPVNWCCIAVKEATGRLRVFLEAKSHPFRGEEYLDKFNDLYRGRHFYLFRGHPACFNFMALVCLDYIYRDLYASNVRQIIDHANRLFFTTRQTLEALFVIQCNPKPEHRAYREVLTGFYGEYLEDTPGVRETVTVFGNSSEESAIQGYERDGSFGVSSVVISRRHKLARLEVSEFSTDDFSGAPLCRLRFGTATRLYYFNLPLHHELDPRSTRMPLKVHRIMRRCADGWARIEGDHVGEGVEIGRLPERPPGG
jgi:hypothetical protein